MFRISRQQFDDMADKTRQDFVRMMDNYLREHFAEWVPGMPKADCESWVRAALAKCERHAITAESEAAQLILLFLVLGLDADESTPWVQEVLTDRELLPIGKLRKLVRLAREQGINQVDDVVVYGHLVLPGQLSEAPEACSTYGVG
jgi:hypothetical protein